MKKIPTIFERDWEGTIGPKGKFVLDASNPDCGWVFTGEGVATRKIDGTCCLIRDGKLYRRHEVKPGKQTPPNFEVVDIDDEAGTKVGWVPVGPEDKWFRKAWESLNTHVEDKTGFRPDWVLPDGTYELVGPHVNGNPEGVSFDYLWSHDDCEIDFTPEYPPVTFEGLKDWLSRYDVEGIVWHHPDGRMAKIKGKDFGIDRATVKANLERAREQGARW